MLDTRWYPVSRNQYQVTGIQYQISSIEHQVSGECLLLNAGSVPASTPLPYVLTVSNPDDATIVSTIVQMGRNLGMDVVAEGVETEDQLAILQRLGCTYAQGLLFGDPMSSDSYLELLLAQAEGTDTYRALFVG